MGHIEATRDLAASPEALWSIISNPNTWGQWFTVHDKWLEEPPATLTPGVRLTAKLVMLNMANKIEWSVKSVEAPSSLSLGGTGMAGVKADFTFTIEPVGAGSRFTVAGDFEGALVKGALAKAVEKDGAKQLDKTLTKLDELASAAV
ncbi:carbon monoxide dehydrogenase subunit G [Mycolicibacterium sp. BK556]|uniref:type II toxin-antitoxin system Rv0910 family toxin n=1 Tax=unclassified Mycolicibacterium TaxID=2636767 RepID=UPI001617B16B|nr:MULTISPECIES: SRPBCC family protein [unclassified Mycolicibacterium]MBB3604992.1 carbon monoxide dehydrogenase subunit G [Mycolicibacterium sp. BK556]MBB3635188.1 carbon monoxide dehydrogenase subunit G [Mycolicibacterium sp. BK607]MBB3748018.1 carbon monoxide dehydrogenase subunit G [Mycolicibacterium sp. BK634]